MGLFKSLSDKLTKKKEEVQKKAMERAAEMALEKSKATAKNAITGVGKKIESALFGDDDEEKRDRSDDDDDEAPSSRAPKKKIEAKSKSKKDAESPVKPAQKEKLEADYEKFVRDRKARDERIEKEVDDDLAAMKKRLAAKKDKG